MGEFDGETNEITLRIALKRFGLGILTVKLTKYPSAGRSARTTRRVGVPEGLRSFDFFYGRKVFERKKEINVLLPNQKASV